MLKHYFLHSYASGWSFLSLPLHLIKNGAKEKLVRAGIEPTSHCCGCPGSLRRTRAFSIQVSEASGHFESCQYFAFDLYV